MNLRERIKHRNMQLLDAKARDTTGNYKLTKKEQKDLADWRKKQQLKIN